MQHVVFGGCLFVCKRVGGCFREGLPCIVESVWVTFLTSLGVLIIFMIGSCQMSIFISFIFKWHTWSTNCLKELPSVYVILFLEQSSIFWNQWWLSAWLLICQQVIKCLNFIAWKRIFFIKILIFSKLFQLHCILSVWIVSYSGKVEIKGTLMNDQSTDKDCS